MSRRYPKLRPKEKLIICCEQWDFSWLAHEINSVIGAWNSGESIQSIAESVDRPVEEVFLLLLDLASQDKITSRKNGIYGG